MAYRLLAAVLAAALLAGGGFVTGRKIERADWLERTADMQNTALETARSELEAERKRAVKEARREALASARSDQARRRGLEHARQADPVCRIDDAALGLYVDAIRAANDSAPDPTGVR